MPPDGFGAIEDGGEMLFRVVAGAVEQAVGLLGMIVKGLGPLPGNRIVSACNSGIAQSHSNWAGTGKVNKVQCAVCPEPSQMAGIQLFLGYRAN